MTSFRTLNSRFSVAAQINAGDMLKARAMGFHAVINIRPDSEQGVSFPSEEARTLAERHNLDYHYLPSAMHMVYQDEAVGRFIHAVEMHAGPVLAHCKSGVRSTVLWALAASRFQPSDLVFHHLMGNGFEELDVLEEDMAEQSRRYLGVEHSVRKVPAIFQLESRKNFPTQDDQPAIADSKVA